MIVLYVVIGLLELALMSYIIFRIYKRRRFSLKETSPYPLIVAIAFCMYIIGFNKYSDTGIGDTFMTSLTSSLKMIALEPNKDFYNLMQDNNNTMFLEFVFVYILSILQFASVMISLFKVFIVNFARKIRFNFFKKNKIYMFGFSEDAKTFISNLDNTQAQRIMVFMERKPENSDKEIKEFLYGKKVPYRTVDYNLDTLLKLSLNKYKKNIISFIEDDNNLYGFIKVILEYINKLPEAKKKYIQFIISGSTDQNHYLNRTLGDRNGLIRCFDKYELLSYQFVFDHPFSKYIMECDKKTSDYKTYLPNGLINDCDINLFMLGFGKVNQFLLDNIICINQFATIKDGLITPKRMNIHVFEEANKTQNIHLANGLLKYQKKDYKPSEYFDLPEDYQDIDFNYNMSIDEFGTINKMMKSIKDGNKKQYNFILVSCDSDIKNTDLADIINSNLDLIEDKDLHNFIFVRTKNDNSLDNRFVNFGSNKSILTYKNVIMDEFYSAAKRRNCSYEALASGNRENTNKYINEIYEENYLRNSWDKLTRLVKYSNLSSIASIPFKLSMMGMSLDNFDKDTYLKIYNKYNDNNPENEILSDANNEIKYEFTNRFVEKNFDYSMRDVFSFLEHERWVAFELSFGIIPMKKEDIVYNVTSEELNLYNETHKKLYEDKKSINKPILKKGTDFYRNQYPNGVKHANIATALGLVQFHDYLESKFPNKILFKYDLEKQRKLSSDAISYDYQLMDDIDKIINLF